MDTSLESYKNAMRLFFRSPTLSRQHGGMRNAALKHKDLTRAIFDWEMSNLQKKSSTGLKRNDLTAQMIQRQNEELFEVKYEELI